VGITVEGHFPVATPHGERPKPPRQFGKTQHNPVRRFGGIAIVIIFHLLLIYALLNGLANKVVRVIQRPIETSIIEPVKLPPPPPFVPPPEVQVQAPPVLTISHQTDPVVSAPIAPPAPPAPAVKAPSTAVGIVCPNSVQVQSSMAYPMEAQENNITGDVVIEFVVDSQGHITDEHVAKSADVLLDRAALNAVKKFNCVSQGQAVRVQVPFSFNLN